MGGGEERALGKLWEQTDTSWESGVIHDCGSAAAIPCSEQPKQSAQICTLLRTQPAGP